MCHGVTFNFGSTKVCSPGIFETSFSYDKDIWIAATDYFMHFYIIVLFPSPARFILGQILSTATCVTRTHRQPVIRCQNC